MTTSATDEYQRALGTITPVWADLLNAEPGLVTEDTDFFQAGGHSLTAMLLVTRIARDFGKSVPLFALVENSTLGAFTAYVLRADDAADVVEERAPDGSTTQTERLLGYNEPGRHDVRNRNFERYYATAMGSAAHAEFCRQVYGRNFGQHGMADFAQIDHMLALLDPEPGDTILDLGCGYGLISRYIAQRTGANVVGVDLSPSAIAYAKGLAKQDSQLSFHEMDVRDLRFPPGTFTHVVSIDTIYYAPSPRELLRRFREIGTDDMRLGVVRTFPIRSFTPETWSPDLTELATLLKEMFGGYDVVDLSREENEHWRKKVAVLESLRDRFVEEGNEELFTFRYKEAAYEAGIEQFRYMFVSSRS
jgi:cyclopropane fatty-acyl-phospholipid synthase-like methyltransferase/aryl carrier-like protein